MRKYCLLSMLLWWGFTTASYAVGADGVQPDAADVRVLIDISGSMKKNDPNNLRRPALRLLVGLLPEDSRAGVWTFGQYVNMQVPLGKVDKAWKARAADGAAKIHSRGLFTNIEDVIKRSSADWSGAPAKYRRHMVLLTDGMVDISKDPALNTASRARVLEQSLPRLKELGVKVHTIALSARADHELMRTLSQETGGWYEQVEDVAQLQRVFLRIFEKVGRPDALPLKDNRFTVDKSIEEATLLVFRAAEGKPTRVIPPSGESFDSSATPSNVSWHRDVGYDLVTITKPQAGEWRIEAALDPDNRVLVVTDLKMHATELPGQLIAGEQQGLSVHFSNKGELVTKKSFLKKLSLKGEQIDDGGPKEPRPLFDDGEGADEAEGDGYFTLLVGEGLAAGKAELILRVEGATFQREQHQTFELLPPVLVETLQEASGEGPATVRITPALGLLDNETLKLEASLVSGDVEPMPVMFLPGTLGGSWEVQVDPSLLTGDWNMGIHLAATTAAGNSLALDLEPIPFVGTMEPEPVVEIPEAAPIVEPPAPESIPETVEQDWLMDAGIFGGANMLLLLLAAAGIWLSRRHGSRTLPRLLVVNEEEAVAQ